MNLLIQKPDGSNAISTSKKLIPKFKELFLLSLIIFLGFVGTSFVIFSHKSTHSQSNSNSISIHQVDVNKYWPKDLICFWLLKLIF